MRVADNWWRRPRRPYARRREISKFRRLIAHFVLVTVAACDVMLPPPKPTEPSTPSGELPPLEQVPFDKLAPGKIVFERLATDGRSVGGVYVIDASAKRTFPSINYRTKAAAAPAVAPDGRSVAFTAYAPDVPCCGVQLHIADIDGSTIRRIGFHPTGPNSSPSWTPDGAQVIVRVTDRLGTIVYRQAPALTTSATQVKLFETTPDSTWLLSGPIAASPSGRLVFKVSRASRYPVRIGLSGIFAMNAEDTEMVRLYSSPDSNFHTFAPTWSPDGRRIAFLGGIVDPLTRQWTTTVELMNEDGTGHTRITTVGTAGSNASGYFGGPNAFSLCWSADGSRIVFSAPHQYLLWHVFVVRADGIGGVTAVTNASGVQDTEVSCSR